MDLFKLVGSIFINNKEANSQIDETNTKAQNLATKIGSAMETAGNKILEKQLHLCQQFLQLH